MLADTDHIHTNNYMNTHKPTRHPSLDKQPSRQTPGRRGVIPDTACQMTTHAADRYSGGWRGWTSAANGADLTLMSLHAAYYLYQIDIGNLPKLMF